MLNIKFIIHFLYTSSFFLSIKSDFFYILKSGSDLSDFSSILFFSIFYIDYFRRDFSSILFFSIFYSS